jgi:hypothetical protein
VAFVLLRFRSNAGWDSYDLQVNSLCASRLRRDAGRANMSLLADKFLPRANEMAGRPGMSVVVS